MDEIEILIKIQNDMTEDVDQSQDWSFSQNSIARKYRKKSNQIKSDFF